MGNKNLQSCRACFSCRLRHSRSHGVLNSLVEGFGDDVFLGCNTSLVAPVKVGDGAYTAAGSVVTEDVPEGALCIARARQVVKPGWVEKVKAKRKALEEQKK